ncbi:MAG: dihydropteroate synthase [Natronospirillum sp.]
MQLVSRGRVLDLRRPNVMGVVNVTPDSFSDGGQFQSTERAVAQAMALATAGATLLDLGGESTRPGAAPVSVEEELARVIPVVEAVRARTDVWISVDTSTAEVMRAAVTAGADMLNDVRALTRPGALEAAAELAVPVCLMHMRGEPATMQADPVYADVVQQVIGYLTERADAALQAGLARELLLFDPGFGFGKTLAHNLDLLRRLPEFVSLGYPLLVGLSRKSMLGTITGKPVEERLAASVAAAVLAAQGGAHIIRVHDVAATVDALAVQQALEYNS